MVSLKENFLKWMLITTPLLEYLGRLGDFLVEPFFSLLLVGKEIFLGYNCWNFLLCKDLKVVPSKCLLEGIC